MTSTNLQAIHLEQEENRHWRYTAAANLPWYTFKLARFGLVAEALNGSVEDINNKSFFFSHGYWPLNSVYSPENAPFANIMTLTLYPFQGAPAIDLGLILPNFMHYKIKGKVAALDYRPGKAKLCWLLVGYLHDSKRHAAFYIPANELEQQCRASTEPFTFECNLGINENTTAISLLFDSNIRTDYEFCLWRDLEHRPFQAHSLSLVLADTELTPVLSDEVGEISDHDMILGNRWTTKKATMPKGCLAFYEMDIDFSTNFKIVSS